MSPQEQLLADSLIPNALSVDELQSIPKRKHHKDAQPQEETHKCYIDGWTITCTQFQPRGRIRSKKRKGKHGKSQEITSRKACYQCEREGHYFHNCPEKSSLQITSEMKLSQSSDMEYEQKCTETSTNDVKTTPPCNSSNRACFGCGDTYHLFNSCPKKNVEINKVQKKRQYLKLMHQQRINNGKKSMGRISYAVIGTIPYENAVIFGTLVIHTTIATVLYDPRTTHSFISAQFATKYGIFKCPLRSGMTISAPERKMFGYMISPPQPQAKATKHMDTQTEELSQAQLYEIQTPSEHSPPVGQANLTRKELKARGACYYYKNEGHIICECPKKRLDLLKKKAAKHDLSNNSEGQPFYKYDDEGRLISIHCRAKKKGSSLILEEFNVN
jgi:hypothetical protein